MPGDQRHTILPFRADLWPHVHSAVVEMKQLAAEAGIPLPALAIRWILARPQIDAVVVGARNRAQSEANAEALGADIRKDWLEQLTAISDAISARIPDVGNLFNHYP